MAVQTTTLLVSNLFPWYEIDQLVCVPVRLTTHSCECLYPPPTSQITEDKANVDKSRHTEREREDKWKEELIMEGGGRTGQDSYEWRSKRRKSRWKRRKMQRVTHRSGRKFIFTRQKKVERWEMRVQTMQIITRAGSSFKFKTETREWFLSTQKCCPGRCCQIALTCFYLFFSLKKKKKLFYIYIFPLDS